MNKLKYISILLLLPSFLFAQEPKRELRGAWVASVYSINWPKEGHINNPSAQKADLIDILNTIQETNMNAIFLQIRPECDALYESAYEPWSRYFSSEQGTYPGYDPLQFAIEEAHKRGLELHAWLNPYRINASPNPSEYYFHETHIYKEHPEWAITTYLNGKYILNPGRPEVMSYIGDVVEDIVSKYAVDGIHFDDYFYSEGTTSDMDQREYDLYGNSMELYDWRRDNINRMIDTVYARIQKTNSNVRFGVSPPGIYRPGIPSGISGRDNYNVLFCDPLAWLENETVDYINPQLYWPTGGGQDFETLINWWSSQANAYNRHTFAGLGTYRLSSSAGLKKGASIDTTLHESKYDYEKMALSSLEESLLKGTEDPVSPWTISEIGKHITLCRSNTSNMAMGSVFYNVADIKRIIGFQDYLLENMFTHPAIIPEMTWKNSSTPSAPTNLRAEDIDGENVLAWDHPGGDNHRYVVYATSTPATANDIINNPENIQAICFENSLPTSELSVFFNSYIIVTTVSAIGEESSPSSIFLPSGDFPFVTLISPGNGSLLGENDKIRWSSEYSDPSYQIQMATSGSFNNIVYTSDWQNSNEFIIGNAGLEGETTYFWRIRVDNGSIGPYSSSRYFSTGFPAVPDLNSPGNLSSNVSRNPLIKWNTSTTSTSIVIQVSESSSFTTITTEETVDASSGEAILSTELEGGKDFYLRIAAMNTYGNSEFCDAIIFSTTEGEIPDVNLIGPADNVSAASFDALEWETTATTGNISYMLEVAIDHEFLNIMYNSGWISTPGMHIQDLKLEGNRTYYWRVKGKSEYGESEFSEIRSFYAGYPTRPSISKPLHLSTNVSAKPIIAWNVDGNTDQVYVEFSKNTAFDPPSHSETFQALPNEAQISVSLSEYTGYYIRLSAINEYGKSVFSALKYFETGEGTGIEAINNTNYFTIYPSILRNQNLIIENNLDLYIEKVYLLNIQGKVLLKREKVGNDSEIILNTELLNNVGTVILKVQTKNNIFITKLMIL